MTWASSDCPRCGTSVSRDAHACPQCGLYFRCRNCAAEFQDPELDRFCMQCGERVQQEPSGAVPGSPEVAAVEGGGRFRSAVTGAARGVMATGPAKKARTA